MSALINDESLAKIWTEIMVERSRAEALHPVYPSDHLRRTTLTCEEAGEALKEANNLTRETTPFEDRVVAWHALRHELIQTAQMAIRQLQAMEEERNG